MPTLDITPSKHLFNALVQDIDANQAINYNTRSQSPSLVILGGR